MTTAIDNQAARDGRQAREWQLTCVMTGANALFLRAPSFVWPKWRRHGGSR